MNTRFLSLPISSWKYVSVPSAIYITSIVDLFSTDLVKFTQYVKELERHDTELARMNNELRCLVIPHMDIVQVPSRSSTGAGARSMKR